MGLAQCGKNKNVLSRKKFVKSNTTIAMIQSETFNLTEFLRKKILLRVEKFLFFSHCA